MGCSGCCQHPTHCRVISLKAGAALYVFAGAVLSEPLARAIDTQWTLTLSGFSSVGVYYMRTLQSVGLFGVEHPACAPRAVGERDRARPAAPSRPPHPPWSRPTAPTGPVPAPRATHPAHRGPPHLPGPLNRPGTRPIPSVMQAWARDTARGPHPHLRLRTRTGTRRQRGPGEARGKREGSRSDVPWRGPRSK